MLLAGGQTERAAELMGTAERVREMAGIAVWPLMKPLADQFTAAVAGMLGAEDFAAAKAAGAGTQPFTALDAALDAALAFRG